jgi:hypothetical protein
MSGFGGPIIGAAGFIGTTLLAGRGGTALATGATAGFVATAPIAFGAPATGAAAFAAPGFAIGRSWTTLATGFTVCFAGFAAGLASGLRAATAFRAGFAPARAGFATAFAGFFATCAGFAGRFAGLAADFFATAFAGAIFFSGFAAAVRIAGLCAFFGTVLAAGFFPVRSEFFLITVFVAKVFSFGRVPRPASPRGG